MKELAVKNYRTAEGQKISQDGNEFTVKPIVAQADVNQCRVNFVEVGRVVLPMDTIIMKRMKRYSILSAVQVSFVPSMGMLQ